MSAARTAQPAGMCIPDFSKNSCWMDSSFVFLALAGVDVEGADGGALPAADAAVAAAEGDLRSAVAAAVAHCRSGDAEQAGKRRDEVRRLLNRLAELAPRRAQLWGLEAAGKAPAEEIQPAGTFLAFLAPGVEEVWKGREFCRGCGKVRPHTRIETRASFLQAFAHPVGDAPGQQPDQKAQKTLAEAASFCADERWALRLPGVAGRAFASDRVIVSRDACEECQSGGDTATTGTIAQLTKVGRERETQVRSVA